MLAQYHSYIASNCDEQQTISEKYGGTVYFNFLRKLQNSMLESDLTDGIVI